MKFRAHGESEQLIESRYNKRILNTFLEKINTFYHRAHQLVIESSHFECKIQECYKNIIVSLFYPTYIASIL